MHSISWLFGVDLVRDPWENRMFLYRNGKRIRSTIPYEYPLYEVSEEEKEEIESLFQSLNEGSRINIFEIADFNKGKREVVRFLIREGIKAGQIKYMDINSCYFTDWDGRDIGTIGQNRYYFGKNYKPEDYKDADAAEIEKCNEEMMAAKKDLPNIVTIPWEDFNDAVYENERAS